jgi:hypothetical protein
MEATVISIVLGLVIVAACLGIPQLVRIRTQRPDEDAYGYLKRRNQSPGDGSEQDATLSAEDHSPGPSRRPSEADRP